MKPQLNAGKTLSLEIPSKGLIRLFGSPALVGQGIRELNFPTKRALKLLAILALEPGQKLYRDDIAAQLWEGDEVAANRLKLRQELHRLGSVLADCHNILEIDRQTLSFNDKFFDSDVAIVLALVRKLSLMNERDAEKAHEQIISLGAADFLEQLDDEWTNSHRQEFGDIRFKSLSVLSEICRKRGEYDRAVSLAEEAICLKPTDSDAGNMLVQALIAAGRLEEASERQRALAVVTRTRTASSGQTATPTSFRELSLREPGLTSGPIFGREKELDRLEELLAGDNGHRLVTITGAGGLGKTKLAVEAIRRLSASFRGRVFFVELADYSDAQLVLDAILRALGVPHNPAMGTVQSIRVALGSPLPALLALDNLEQFGESGASVIARLLEGVEGLSILATSRSPIGIEEERVFSLKPLAIEGEDIAAALAMFESVARRFDTKFAIDESNRSILEEIVRLLEGVPLSIHLAASRVRALGPSTLRRALSDRFTILESSSEPTPRHKNLRSCLDWSFELLAPEYRQPFAFLSVFRDGFTAEQAKAATQIDPIENLLSRLEAHSLIYSTEGPDGLRYRMLESIREYGGSRLSLQDSNLAHSRHLKAISDFTTEFVKYQIGEEQATWFRKADAEHANMLEAVNWGMLHDQDAALRLCMAYSRYWLVRGLQSMGNKVLQGVLRDYTGPRNRAYADIHWSIGNMCLDKFDVPCAERHYLAAKEVYLKESHDRVPGALYNLGNLKILEWKYAEAVRLYTENLEWVDPNNARDVAFPLSGLAFAHRGLGNLRTAKKLGLRSVEIARDSKDPFCLEYRLLYMGAIHVDRLDFTEARSALVEARALSDQIGDRRGLALALQFEAEMLFLEVDLESARQKWSEAKELWKFIGHRYRLAECSLGVGRSWTIYEPEKADQPLFEAFDLWDALHFMPGQLLACQALIRARSTARGPEWTAKMLAAATKFRLEYDACFLPREQRIMSALEGSTMAELSVKDWEAYRAEGEAIPIKCYLKQMRS